jgi:hypothetical protein
MKQHTKGIHVYWKFNYFFFQSFFYPKRIKSHTLVELKRIDSISMIIYHWIVFDQKAYCVLSKYVAVRCIVECSYIVFGSTLKFVLGQNVFSYVIECYPRFDCQLTDIKAPISPESWLACVVNQPQENSFRKVKKHPQ